MCQHICSHGGAGRPFPRPSVAMKLLHPPIHQRTCQQLATPRAALFQRFLRLLLRASRGLQWNWQLHCRRRQSGPLHPHIMHMRKNRRNRARSACWHLRAPCCGLQVLQHYLIHALAHRKALHERPSKIANHAHTRRCSRHVPPHATGCIPSYGLFNEHSHRKPFRPLFFGADRSFARCRRVECSEAKLKQQDVLTPIAL